MNILFSQELIVSTGKLAKFADGCAIAQMGETTVMVTAVSAKQPKLGANFLPLTVSECRQKYIHFE